MFSPTSALTWDGGTPSSVCRRLCSEHTESGLDLAGPECPSGKAPGPTILEGSVRLFSFPLWSESVTQPVLCLERYQNNGKTSFLSCFNEGRGPGCAHGSLGRPCPPVRGDALGWESALNPWPMTALKGPGVALVRNDSPWDFRVRPGKFRPGH